MYQSMVAIHLIAAVTWLGGMLFLVMVMLPLARRTASAAKDSWCSVKWRDGSCRWLGPPRSSWS